MKQSRILRVFVWDFAELVIKNLKASTKNILFGNSEFSVQHEFYLHKKTVDNKNKIFKFLKRIFNIV